MKNCGLVEEIEKRGWKEKIRRGVMDGREGDRKAREEKMLVAV